MDKTNLIAERDFLAKDVTQLIGLNPNTVRKYLLTDPVLRVDAGGEDRSGWRRFTMADMVRLSLVRRLTVEFQIAASAAIELVNRLFDQIAFTTQGAIKTAQDLGGWFDIDPVFIVVYDARPGMLNYKGFNTRGQLLDELDNLHRPAIVFDLTKMVKVATAFVPGMAQQ